MVPARSMTGSLGKASKHLSGPLCSTTRELRHHSHVIAAIFPTPPAIGHPSTTHKYLQRQYNTQASALRQTPHAIGIIPNITARHTSSPIQHLPSRQPVLQQLRAKWSDCCESYAFSLEEKFSQRFQECEETWFERWTEKNKEAQEKSIEIITLTSEVLCGKIQIMKCMEKYNIRGALEHMVYHAKLMKEIRTDCPSGIQAGLNEIAKTPEFTKVLHQEVASRDLVLKDVIPCIALAYDSTHQHAHGNDYIITLYEGDYTPNEICVLAAFLRLQREWSYGLEWREDKREEDTTLS